MSRHTKIELVPSDPKSTPTRPENERKGGGSCQCTPNVEQVPSCTVLAAKIIGLYWEGSHNANKNA